MHHIRASSCSILKSSRRSQSKKAAALLFFAAASRENPCVLRTHREENREMELYVLGLLWTPLVGRHYTVQLAFECKEEKGREGKK